jgi:hypothetical protein
LVSDREFKEALEQWEDTCYGMNSKDDNRSDDDTDDDDDDDDDHDNDLRQHLYFQWKISSLEKENF